MQCLIYITIILTYMTSHIIFDFNKKTNIENWIIVDDVVMGGKSSGTFKLSAEGHGVFEGAISLENNGGFSSVRYRFEKTLIRESTKIILKIRGDGKKYQFRIKSNSDDYYSYISPFSTTGEWQEIQILLKDMYPSFRGRKLDQPNFSNDYIEEIAFLIGNNSQEEFKFLIDKIELK
ncbi:CIA30 family protein [Carboxylicivirga marina]|uniref:CIA30 family protein n=2 Tax=Carboxylicivirga TaxID=1628153 RepID=A0ABS1HE98_9BACT|nr:CIA30 family protein [Carboxylicivirga marina]MBK3515969.1 CIA30 family protein [Carboxylicivirga marina]